MQWDQQFCCHLIPCPAGIQQKQASLLSTSCLLELLLISLLLTLQFYITSKDCIYKNFCLLFQQLASCLSSPPVFLSTLTPATILCRVRITSFLFSTETQIQTVPGMNQVIIKHQLSEQMTKWMYHHLTECVFYLFCFLSICPALDTDFMWAGIVVCFGYS